MTDTAPVHRIARLSIVVLAVMLYASAASAQPSLGSAGNFGALGATTVTNTGLTVVTGDVGVSPGTAITGFPPGTATGTIHRGGMIAARAHADAFIASEELKAMVCDEDLTGQELGGMTLTPGVYCFSSSAQLTGTLNLVGGGPWIFKIGSTLTTASASSVLVNPARTCSGANVFWQVGSSATLGTGSGFAGNILATASITATTGVSVSGSLLAINGAVTMDTNLVTACGAGTVPPDDDDECKDHRGKCKCKCKCKDHHHGGDRGDHDRGDHRNCNRHDNDHDRGDHRNCNRHDGHHDRDDHDGDRGDRNHGDNDRDHDHDNDNDNDRDRDKDRNDKNDKGRDNKGRR